MWKATAGHNIVVPQNDEDDDWETDPDFINDVTEQEQRWGSKTVEGSGRTAGAINMTQLRHETEEADATKKKKAIEEQNPGFGYGGKFGVEHDRMDKSAMGHDYIGKVEKHASQKDYSDGFGGKFGVQTDRVDKSAVSWDHKEKVEKHSSQKDYATGFGGKYGVQNDRVDKSAVGWDHMEKVEKHESQKDYSKGFGGKFGVQEDRKDKSALGWDYVEAPQKHESQVDHKMGFGGKFGVQNDRMDKSALGFEDNPEKIGTNYTKTKPDIGGAKPSNLRAKFENLAKSREEDDQRGAAEQKKLREEKDKLDRDEAAKKTSFDSTAVESKPVQRKGNIDTGRSGGIGNAISAFNQAQSPTETAPPQQRKDPIKLPKQPEPVVKAQVPVQPDVIPTQMEVAQPVPPPAAFTNEPTAVAVASVGHITETSQEIYANIQKSIETTSPPNESRVSHEQSPHVATTEDQQAEPIYQNQEDLSEYIDDTGVRAIALYDYQAAAEDEISFDPEDVITHIEQIDEGWWRGLCKNRYGLFPANYVQLQQ